jgi:Flp pilus assembly protein TadG
MMRARKSVSSPFLTGYQEQAGAGAPRRARRSGERGGTLVEFAFTFVITIILMFAMIDFARALYSYHFVTNAAREAARWASVRGQMCTGLATPCPAQSTDISNYVTQQITPLGIDSGNVTVIPTVAANGETVCGGLPPAYPGCPISVEVDYTFNYLFPISFYNLAPVSFQAGQYTMRSTAQIVDSR